jgi:16S rRNA (guanine966-N2)-methyltransferase
VGQLRVIGGERKGFRLASPRGSVLRPTSGRVREAFFDILAGEIAGARFLDLFAGTGAMGIEALSRGAASSLFVEEDRGAVEAIRRNLEACGFRSRGKVLAGRLPGALRRLGNGAEFDLIFVDPPYGDPVAEDTLAALGELRSFSPQGRVVLEHRKSWTPPGLAGGLCLERTVRYGDTALSFFEARGTTRNRVGEKD